MSTERKPRVASNDRSMDAQTGDRSEVFFFPKHKGKPVSVRAASREEAERLLEAALETPNPKEHD